MRVIELCLDACVNHAKRLFIGFSGGLDSTVLLHILASNPLIRSKLSIVHINHGLSPLATHWQRHCQDISVLYQLPFITKNAQFNKLSNIEEAARQARYEIFQSLMTADDGLLLAHHQDDQAETLLLHLLRGAGIDGLAAMPRIRVFASGFLYRPLLDHTRQEIQNYALLHQLRWIDDESNDNSRYSRNFMRNQVLPLMKTRWPQLVNNLARTALHCQEARSQLSELATMDYGDFHEGVPLDLSKLQGLSSSRINNVLRRWLQTQALKLPDQVTFDRIQQEVIKAREDANPEVSWGGFCVRRYRQRLFFLKKNSLPVLSDYPWTAFPQALIINELQLKLEVVLTAEAAPFQSVVLRFAVEGAVFLWHGQHKSLKKLWQSWAVPPWMRSQTPLLYINNEFAAIANHAIADPFKAVLSEFKVSTLVD